MAISEVERELMLLESMQGNVLEIPSPGSYTIRRVQDKIATATGQTLAQIGTHNLAISPTIKSRTG